MSKNLLQDVKRTVKKDKVIFRPPQEEPKKNTSGRKIWFVALFSIVFLFFALSFLFARAKVTVIPKAKDIVLSQNLSASKDSNGSGLSFDLVVISGEESKSIKGGEASDVLAKAKGKVFIYNATSSAQQLSIDTRLEGSNGKIYKTVSKTIVPAFKAGQPGKVEVGIYGDVAGEEYNSGPLDFTVLGFKGTAKYSKFYARSTTDISGGLKGKYYQITETQKQTTVGELKSALSEKLLKKATDQIPNGFILFKDAIFLDINEDSINTASEALAGNDMVNVTLKGTLSGILFNEEKLTKEIAKDAIDNYDGNDVHISNIKSLTFSIPDRQTSFANVQNINFNLSGASRIVWDVDSAKLVSDLVGKSKKDFNQILSTYSDIDSAEVSIRPFWKMSFPDKNIEVIINDPK